MSTRLTFSQAVVDSCFTSANVGTSFSSGTNLYNQGNSDLLEWNGSSWVGSWPLAGLTIPPPLNQANCRAVFIGSGVSWTTGGESFGLQLSAPLVAGQSYSFDFTYVSHGLGSTGAFTPLMFTNFTAATGGAFSMPNLPPVGYTWTTNTVSFTASAAQNGHDVIIIDSGTSGASGSGIVNSLCETCNIAAPCSIDLGPDIALCTGETVLLDATTPGMTYTWQDASTNPTFNVTQAGTYWVEITDGTCTNSDTVVVTYNPIPSPNLGNDTTFCNNPGYLLDATQASATYAWNNASTNATLNTTLTGTYWVDVTVNGCTGSDTINLTFNNILPVDLGPDVSLCDGDQLLLDASGTSGTYLWQDASTNATFNVTQAGTYWVEITDGPCTTSDTIVVSYNPVPTPNLGNDTSICLTSGYTLDATQASATYLWNDASTNPTLTTSLTGMYWVDVTVNGCTGSDTINLVFDNNIAIDLGNDTTLCDGATLLLDASGPAGTTYLWQDASVNSTFNVTSPGQFYVTLTNSTCTGSDTIDVLYDVTVPFSLGNDTTVCDGQTVVISPDIAVTAPYLWQDGSSNSTFTAGTTGIYWLEGGGNCPFRDSMTLTVQPNIIVDLGPDTQLCPGQVITLDASAGIGPYIWSDGSSNSTLDVNASGTYWVQYGDLCPNTDTIVISDEVLTVSMFISDSSGCTVPLTVQFTGVANTNAVGALSWFWDFGDAQTSTQQNPSHTYQSSGTYTVSLTVTTANGCSETATNIDWIEIYAIPTANFSFSPNSPTTFESEVTFTNLSSNETSWFWNFGDGSTSTEENPMHEFPSTEGGYTIVLTVYNDYGCADSISRTIFIEDVIIFYVPNSFTPDGDEFNNDFGPVVTAGIDLTDFNFTIYNRWGEVIFESFDANGRWDGTFAGSDVQDGVYTWALNFQELASDKRYVYTGHVTMIR